MDAASGQDSEGDIDMTDAAAEVDATAVAPASSLLGHQARLQVCVASLREVYRNNFL